MNRLRGWSIMLFVILLLATVGLTGCRGDEVTNGPIGSASPTPSLGPSSTPSPTASGAPSNSPAPSPTGSGGTSSAAPVSNEMGRVTAVRLADPKIGWTGGATGWISRTEDGGRTWKKQYQGTGTVQQIFALNGQDVWAVHSPDAGKPAVRDLLRSSDGGSKWAVVGRMPNASFLHFVSKEEAFVGNQRSTDGGKSWTALAVPSGTVGDAYFHDKDHGWAVTAGEGNIVVQATADGGRTWNKVMTRKSAAPVNGTVIRSAGVNDAWVEFIGESGMSQTSYSLFHTTDGGKTWQPVLANSTAGGGPAPGYPIDYTDGPKNAGSKPGQLYVVDPNAAFMAGFCPACDNASTIGYTKDGGKTWVNSKASYPGFGEARLAFADAKQGWWITTDVTEPSVMYTTADGGVSWTKVHTFDKPK